MVPVPTSSVLSRLRHVADASTKQIRLSWLLLVLAALVVAFAPLPDMSAERPVERRFLVQAGQYSYSPAEFRVNRGDTVTFELASTDTVHGLFVDGYGVSVQADPGQPALLTFVADRPGSFRLRCNITCGALHPFMLGKLTVGQNALLFRGATLGLLGALGVLLVSRRVAPPGIAI